MTKNTGAHAKFPNPEIMQLINTYKSVRRQTEILCQPLEIEDYGVQAMPSVSPPKWHLAHTSWFFETFLLQPHCPQFKPYNEIYAQLFNSYYHRIGKFLAREQRGVLSRPTVSEIYCYRIAVDEQITALLLNCDAKLQHRLSELLLLGLAHEQQHQELLLTDVKYNLAQNPLLPSYMKALPFFDQSLFGDHTLFGNTLFNLSNGSKLHWLDFEGGSTELGSNGAEFCFDNELPRHRVLLTPFKLANRPVSNGEYLQFIRDDGYARPELWLSDGWLERERQHWTAPLYWTKERIKDGSKEGQKDGSPQDGKWQVFTLHGLRPLNLAEPVCHVSYYEADAYARWADARLPTEAEWEHVAADQEIAGHFANDGVLQPRPATKQDDSLQQLFGDVWEWTASAYAPYPGFKASSAAIGEYNGKFMCNQMVLRGGSCATAREHMRASYRNFFYPGDRWQFTGIRLARSAT